MVAELHRRMLLILRTHKFIPGSPLP
uniref:Uncharacterized protein n=1 Tax=Arundo donax TaxID=35708 RepID=A0A0A9B2V0_ARUDO